MKKLFTLTLALLASFSLSWATSYIPGDTKSVTANETLEYSTFTAATATASGNWIVNPRGSNTSSKGYTNVTNDSNGNPDEITDNIQSTSSNVGMQTIQVPTTAKYNQNGRYVIHMRLTGITGIIVHGTTGSSSRGVAIYGQEYTNSLTENTEYGSALASMTRANNGGSFILQYTSFTASKEYLITIAAVGGDVQLYAIELIAGSVTPACPSGLTISGNQEYTEGEKIELTAALSAGNGTITYQWYKGSITVENAIDGATSEVLTINACTTEDAGDYFCVASKDGCDNSAESSAYTLTVSPFTCPTSGKVFSIEFVNAAKVTMSDGDNLTLTSDYATISNGSASIKYFKSGNKDKEVLTTGHLISYGTNDQYLKLELLCALQAGDTIKFADGTGDQLAIATDDGTPLNSQHKVATTGYKYVVIANDELEGKNTLYIGRNTTTTSKHGKLTITRPTSPATAIDNTNAKANAVKTLKNGVLIIEKNGKKYNIIGSEIR